MTYVFPELACYKKGWVPVLEMAKLALDQEDYLCLAVDEAAIRCEGQYGGAAWQELGDEIKDAIDNSLGIYMTVSTWYWCIFGKSISKHKAHSKKVEDYRAYRLAWLDHIIARCEK